MMKASIAPSLAPLLRRDWMMGMLDSVVRYSGRPTAEASGTRFTGSLKDTLERVEREIVLDALKSARGNMSEAARVLGLTERIMGLRVRKYGITYRRYRKKP
jgi:DNA-binding NtrC family response regulator